MAYATILAQIKTYIETVPARGTVHDYVRWYKDQPAMLTLFAVSSPSEQIRFWDISRVRTSEKHQVSVANTRTYTFRVRFFMSLNDASATEKTFQGLLELVCAVFRNVPTFNGLAVDSTPLQVDSVGHVQVGDVLCHMAECSIMVEEDISWTE